MLSLTFADLHIPAVIRFSLSDLAVSQQAASAIAYVASSQPVEGSELGSQRQRPQLLFTNLWTRLYPGSAGSGYVHIVSGIARRVPSSLRGQFICFLRRHVIHNAPPDDCPCYCKERKSGHCSKAFQSNRSVLKAFSKQLPNGPKRKQCT